jgi:hypothetical protein
MLSLIELAIWHLRAMIGGIGRGEKLRPVLAGRSDSTVLVGGLVADAANAAGGTQGFAGDPVGVIRSQEDRDRRDILGLACFGSTPH